jgi:hypothetical protein
VPLTAAGRDIKIGEKKRESTIEANTMLRITCVDVVQELGNRVFMQVAVICSKRGVLRQLSTAIRPRLRLGLARRMPRDLISLPTSPHSRLVSSTCELTVSVASYQFQAALSNLCLSSPASRHCTAHAPHTLLKRRNAQALRHFPRLSHLSAALPWWG